MEETSTAWIDISLYASYAMILISMVAAVVMPLLKAVGDPQSLVKSAIAVVGLLIIFGICYALSSSEVPVRFTDPSKGVLYTTPTNYQMIGGSLVMVYVLSIITFAAVVYGEVTKFFK